MDEKLGPQRGSHLPEVTLNRCWLPFFWILGEIYTWFCCAHLPRDTWTIEFFSGSSSVALMVAGGSRALRGGEEEELSYTLTAAVWPSSQSPVFIERLCTGHRSTPWFLWLLSKTTSSLFSTGPHTHSPFLLGRPQPHSYYPPGFIYSLFLYSPYCYEN